MMEVLILEINVLTYNIHHGKGADGKLNINRIAEVIGDSGADIVGLNEVDICFSKRSRFIDQLSWLSDTLNMHHAFGATVTLQSQRIARGQYGNALLSRYPIIYQNNRIFHGNTGHFERRALLETEVNLQEKPVKIFVTHLSLNPWRHYLQVNMILQKIKETRLPVILLGDLNMKPGTKSWKKISQILTDVCHKIYAAPCRTFPSRRPKIQLDYIFVSEHFHIASVEFISKHRLASDHIPIKAVLTLQR
jgi:endonuclease/exonuclease/phosphatase family metal-dependent hydrolase